MASPFIPATAATVQDGNLLHASGPNGGGGDVRGDSIGAVWPSLSILRNPYAAPSVGVDLVWLTFWDLSAAFRAAAYKRVAFQVA